MNTGPHQFQMPAWISAAPFEKLLQMTIVEASEGKATLTMPFLIDFANGAAIMHGGALVGLADTAVVMAIKRLLEPGSPFATVRAETRFLHPVRQGVVTAKARILSRVDRTIEGEATIYDEEERAVMELACTFKIARNARITAVTWDGVAAGPAAPNEQLP